MTDPIEHATRRVLDQRQRYQEMLAEPHRYTMDSRDAIRTKLVQAEAALVTTCIRIYTAPVARERIG